MIVVKVELYSAVTRRITRLATAYISNVGGTVTRGDYDAQFWKGDPEEHHRAPARASHVSNYPRKAVAVWNLVRQAIAAAGYNK